MSRWGCYHCEGESDQTLRAENVPLLTSQVGVFTYMCDGQDERRLPQSTGWAGGLIDPAHIRWTRALCDVRKGRFSKRLVTANHTHT